MSVLTIILGVLLMIGGIVCLCTPAATTFGIMYFYMILLFVTGIAILIRCIATRNFGIDFFFSILTLILGVFVLFSSNMSFATAQVLLYIIAAWLIVRGVVGMIASFRTRRIVGGGLFALGLITSVLLIIAGVYSFIHPLYFAEFLGILASIYFIIEGIDLIVLGCSTARITRL